MTKPMPREVGRLVTLGIVAVALATGVGAAEAPEDLAQAAAEAWLATADRGDAAATWEQAAKSFQAAVTKEQWQQALAGVRAPLGTVSSRKLLSRQFTDKLPGAPEGKYVVLQYETVFEHKTGVTETVVPMFDADGVWRVSGYFVR